MQREEWSAFLIECGALMEKVELISAAGEAVRAPLPRAKGVLEAIGGPRAAGLNFAKVILHNGFVECVMPKAEQAWRAMEERVERGEASPRVFGRALVRGLEERELSALRCCDHVLDVELEVLEGHVEDVNGCVGVGVDEVVI